MHCQFDALGRLARLAAQPRALRRCDLADITGALDQQYVGLAGFRKRIGHAAANGTATDDDDFGVRELVHDSRAWCVVRESWIRGAWCVVREVVPRRTLVDCPTSEIGRPSKVIHLHASCSRVRWA